MFSGKSLSLFSLTSKTRSCRLCCKSCSGSALNIFPSISKLPFLSLLPPNNNCNRAGMGRNNSSGKSFKRFWLSDKISKAVSPVNVSDSTCVKPKRPKSRNRKLPKGANNLFGKTGSRFPNSDNFSKPNANVKASSATLVICCSLKLTTVRRRTPMRLQFTRCFVPSSFCWQLHGKHPKLGLWTG